MQSNDHYTHAPGAGPADIAVVGMACRFPGAGDYDEFWRNIAAKKDCIREVPEDRWSWRQYFGDPRTEPNKTGVKWGGFIEDLDKFDPLFFGISPTEAAFIDPQHRLFLEGAWHAVEDAGYSIASLSGKAIGVYAGVSKNDYAESMREGQYEIAPYVSTGTVHSILVNRVSFLFNLRGRSEAVDTACSSSLVALHNAIRDIASGECEAAIVGGVNALISPTMFISHSKSGMLAPDGHCKTFSATADGYVRGEGVGVLFIKPLRQALIDRDHVHAVIKSSAINHGGRSNFLTSPSTEAQAAVVAQALTRGGIDPRSMNYVEAHGTGTPLGDPIEINGLKKAFAQAAREFPPAPIGDAPYCALGSVKTNVGHLESASGMAGIIKVIMAMKHGRIPPIRSLDALNPYIELEDSPFYIATESGAWERGPLPRRAGVSSFGMGGVNAHVVLEEPPEGNDQVAESRGYVVPLSARKGRLRPYAEALLQYLRAEREGDQAEHCLRDVAYTLQVGRDRFEDRLAIVATSIADLISGLETYLAGEAMATGNLFTSEGADAGFEAREGESVMLRELASRWTRGESVDWGDVPESRRLPLPTYPFARKRCWYTDVARRISNAAPEEPARVHAERDGSAPVLRASDFFIRDHVVRGNHLLPGVAHLELARAAAQPSADQRVGVLKNVYWIKPVVVSGEDVRLDVRLTPRGSGTDFEILQDGTLHSKGSLETATTSGHGRKIDLHAIRSRCSAGKSKTELYAMLAASGLAYGPTFQVIENFVSTDRELLAELALPTEVHAGLETFVLHPSLMDGMFQAVTTLSLLQPETRTQQFVPFFLGSAEFAGTMSDRCFVHASIREDGAQGLPSFNATLVDGDGNVLVALENLQKRPLRETGQSEKHESASGDMYYRPVWLEKAVLLPEPPTRRALVLFARDEDAVEGFGRHGFAPENVVVVLPGESYRQRNDRTYEIDPRNARDYERLLGELKTRGHVPTRVAYLWGMAKEELDLPLQDRLDSSIYGVLHFTQAAFQARFRDDVRLVYVHALADGLTQPVHSAVAGFARTLKYENPKFDYVTLGLDRTDAESIAAATCAELQTAADGHSLREVSIRKGNRYERKTARLSVAFSAPGNDSSSMLRRGGVYVLSGGAGGLGLVISRHLAERYAATVLWLGRSPKSPEISRRIGDIEQLGGKAKYFSADVTDGSAVTAVLARIKADHPHIHGVIHAAGLIEDAFILRKQRDSFARVIEPKILGAMHLDAATQNEKLDFFLMFSSIAAWMPNQGQCDYAAANSFLDSFAESRNALTVAGQRSGVSLALDWPLWAEGGIRVSAEEERHLMRVFGMKPLQTAEGLAVFETSLKMAREQFPELHQIIAIEGDREKIARSLCVAETAEIEGAGEEGAEAGIERELETIFAARLGVAPRAVTSQRTLGELGVDSSTLIGVTRDINARFQADLKPTLLFDVNTVGKLAAHLVSIGKRATSAPEAAPRCNRTLIDLAQSDPARGVYRKTFQTSAFYLRDHVVDGQFNMPGACYVEMARQAAALMPGSPTIATLANNYWASPLSSPRQDFEAQVHFTRKPEHLAYEIVSFGPGGERRLHAMGQIPQGARDPRVAGRIDIAEVTARCDETQYPEQIYRQIRSEGLTVGPTFQPMTRIVLNDEEALATLKLPDEVRDSIGDYVLHPALLTGAFQAALISNKRRSTNARWYIPIGMDELEIFAPIPAECHVHCRPRAGNARNEEMRKFDLEICGTDGAIVVTLKGFAVRALKEDGKAAPGFQAVASESSIGGQAGRPLLAAVQELIRSKLAGPVGLPAGEIDLSTQFDQYGVTSVMVVQLNQIFEDMLGPIPKTLFFEYRNVAELADYLLEHHGDVLSPLLTNKPEPFPASSPSGAEQGDGESRLDEVHAFLRSLMAGPIGLAADEIDVSSGFDQYGVNSVMVVELNEIFEKIFGPLSKTLFFEYRSVDELARYFLEEHRQPLLTALPSRATLGRSTDVEGEEPRLDQTVERGSRPSAGPASVNDIAIISAAGRFPGARNLDELWDVLRNGRDCITEIPADHFDYRRYYDADPERNGIYGRWGGFLDDVDRFDPAFFGISPREAEWIDPQERLLLEVVWEMLEHAGYTRGRLSKVSDRRVGVFVGALWQPYESAGVEATLAGNPAGPSALLYSIANRVSYFLDLAGPSMAIDTACSSSLTALHLACQSIRSGESRCAIVAGVNLSLAASKYLFLSRNRFLSTDGRCRSYGAGGDGYVPGEGVCALLVKPLAQAIDDGDAIMAVIKGSAINHGGRTNGYTVPNPKAQGSVITEALSQAGVDPQRITYIEGHGTGTSLGDPIEISGLEKALNPTGSGTRVCAIGSVKSNIGHLEAAAGIASTIKVLLQLQHGQLAPSIHTEQLNPNIDFSRSLFRVQRDLAPWTRPEVEREGRLETGPRCAGVSSFGAGGSNAHLILEEYDGVQAPSLSRSGLGQGPALCVFSARNEDRLFALLERFETHLREQPSVSVHDLAHTLQLGREAMRERLAIVAGSIEELRASLDDVLKRNNQRSNWRRGSVPAKGGRLADGTSPAIELSGERNLFQAAEAWVKGADVDWTELYAGRQYGFLALPTYPFADEHYWIEGVTRPTGAGVMTPVARLHPLLHRNTSGASELRYSSVFTGDEFFFADHRVRMENGSMAKVLPGVACLEMARAAIEQAWPARSDAEVLELYNVVWAQPIVAAPNREISIVLAASGGHQLDYRIVSEQDGVEVLHGQGRAAWRLGEGPATLDLKQIERRMSGGRVAPAIVYAAFAQTGGIYGPSFQGVTAIQQGTGELLASLRLPAIVQNTLGDYVLHPSVMDSALQGYYGLVEDWLHGSDQTRLPFALESLTVLAPCGPEMMAWMRYAPGIQAEAPVVKFDVDLCDPRGRVCVRLRGFAVRSLKPALPSAKKESQGSGQLVTLAPFWDALKPDAAEIRPRSGERVVMIGGDESRHAALRQICEQAEVLDIDRHTTVEELCGKLREGARIDHLIWILPSAQVRALKGDEGDEGDGIIADQEEGVLLGFRLIKALLREGYGAGELGWTVITRGTQRVGGRPEETVDATHGSVAGLVGSMAKEYRNWFVRLVDVSGEEWPWEAILRLPRDERGDGWAWREGQWYRRRLVEWQGGAREGAASGYRRGGVYVVIGGAGGVGQVLSEDLIRRYDARMVWIGRRERDEAIQQRQTLVSAGGGQPPLYIAADARSREELVRARQEIKERYGRIDGVIHSSIVLTDKSLANMSDEQFRAALSAKVDVAVRLAQVFGSDALDFMLYFSSLQTFLKAPGQGNYAAGCTFTDAFADWQSGDAGYPVKVMNWGYWGSVGVVAGQEYQERMARMGWGSIGPEEGMAGLERLLNGPIDQMGMIRVRGDEPARALGVIQGQCLSKAEQVAPSVSERLAEEVISLERAESLQELRSGEERRREWDALLVKMLRGQVERMGWKGEAPGAWSEEQWRQRTGLAGEYGRWWSESLRILARNGGAREDQVRAQGEELWWRAWEKEKSRFDEQGHGMRAQVKLVDAALRNMDAILRGSKRATDVLFPDSSLALVEGVYKNNPVSDHFNEVMADVVRCYVRARRREEGSVSPGLSLRLLELGAGTGGSSQRILQTLDGDRDAVVEYCYSDVSRWFLRHGEQEFGAGREYLTYAVVDVEKGLPEQGVECGAYDMVLAANVLHATHRLRETLRNAKAALKENGILVLNEIGTKSVSMHLTFGLLAGWWAYEDEELRMEGSPGVTAETWKRVLEEEGFRNVGFPARDAHRFGQQIVVAESDGIIRQVRDGAPHRPAAVTPHVLHVRPAVAAAPVPAPTESAALLPRVERWLMDAVGVLLKVRREDVDVDAELSEFGFDSISLTGFANHVNHAHGLDLMPTIFFEHPTIRRFARHLVQAHQARLEETFHAEPPRSSPVLPTLHTRRRADKGLLAEVEQWLVQAVGTLLKVRKEDVDLDAELSELGFDSISLTGLANHVNRAHALELMPTIFFEHPTVSRLARYLVEMHADRLNATLGLTSVDSPIAAKARRRESAEDTVGEGYASGPQTAAPSRSHGNASRPMASGEEAIAIIGMSGRFPGADDLDRFWENLQAGKQSVMEVPRHRWDWRVVNEGRNGEGDTGAKWGAFIDGVDEFDPLFFGISPREAERIDPQHRLTMMYGWKAFEDAGYGPKQLWGSRTGVFIGTTNTGYGELLTQAGVGIEGFTATGLVPSVGPNRLSFFLNLHGPSEPIETACSSSLVAVHRAVRAIQAGDCEMALVGGVNTLFPTLHTSFYRAGMLSPDGKCKTFSSRADGYVRGEGVGMVVLKPRSAAERDGDHIYGLIRGSAENHGGRAQSLTAPNPQAQAELIKDAYRRAGFSPGSVSYIEAHGTGTSLGDPIEVNGLKSAFQSLFDERGEQPHSGYCGLGSVKSNIGHLELASGMAGLIKILLQLKHATLVPTLHCDEINPYIRLENSPFYIVKDSQPWTRSKDAEGREWPRRAGVSSFGFGGVNAHIVVEEYVAPPAMEREADRRDERDPFIVVLSARDPERLKEQAVLLRDAIGQGGFSDGDLAGMACTLQLGREAMDHRLGMKIESLRDLEQKLESFIEGKTQIAGLFLGAVERNSETLVLFRGDEELQEAVEKWIEKGKWSKLLELWVKGLEVDWEQLYGGEKPGRLSLPTYPFARERCWIDVPASPQDSSRGSAVLHPLLHTNTSDLTGQRYSSTFTGEEFFLTDHRVRMHGGEAQKVLPGVAYLEMARAAIERASAVRPEASVLELRNTVWLVPIVVTQRREISLALAATDDDQIAFDVHSVEAGQKTIHCQGRAIFRPQRTPVRLDLAQLDSQMQEARLTAADVYGVLTRMGLDYGPAHQGIANLRLGRNQLLAQLHIPAALRTTESDYVLHPALMDSALQAAVGLIVDLRRVPNHPPVPFVLDSLRLASPCGAEMFVWARHAEGSTGGDRLVRLDIDVCDPQGNVCVEMRGFSSQAMDGIPKVLHEDSHRMAIRPASAQETSAAFDDAHYLGLIADIVNHRVSVDEAVELEWESLLP